MFERKSNVNLARQKSNAQRGFIVRQFFKYLFIYIANKSAKNVSQQFCKLFL